MLEVSRSDFHAWHTRDEARAEVFDYIERFYSPRRRYSKLGDLSPMEFEARAMPAQPAVQETGTRSARLNYWETPTEVALRSVLAKSAKEAVAYPLLR